MVATATIPTNNIRTLLSDESWHRLNRKMFCQMQTLALQWLEMQWWMHTLLETSAVRDVCCLMAGCCQNVACNSLLSSKISPDDPQISFQLPGDQTAVLNSHTYPVNLRSLLFYNWHLLTLLFAILKLINKK